MTPGQAAYEASFSAHRKLRNVEWAALDKWDRMYWDEIASAAVAAEREACAKACEAYARAHWDHEGGAINCAAAIRARGTP